MLPLKYPTGKQKATFEKEYISLVFNNEDRKQEFIISLNKILKKIGYTNNLTLDDILTRNIEWLAEQSENINHLLEPGSVEEDELKELFNYSDRYQPKIAEFFSSQQQIKLRTCFYCNIDYINTFIGLGNYVSLKDFLFTADKSELMKLNSIGDTKASKVIDLRKKATKVEDLGLSKNLLKRLWKIDFRNLEIKDFDQRAIFNHFTLDHILSKAMHPLTSLSLYNFVPSCYACNSKFKKEKPLICKATTHNSPTSEKFNYHITSKFKYIFTSCKAISNPANDKGFSIELEQSEESELYGVLFKLEQRYREHTDIALDLLEKRQKYSESQLLELSRKLNIPVDTIKANIFGKEIFEEDDSRYSFSKYKKDLSKQLKVIE
tara:strand:- start:1158 stop:2291 length:1134 start_codon:yes stop_codon:yes gene_type:complete